MQAFDPLLSSSEVYDWCYARRRALGQRIPQRHRHSVYRLLVVMCDPIDRDPRHCAIIWRLKTPAAEQHPRRQIEIIREIARPILPIFVTMSVTGLDGVERDADDGAIARSDVHGPAEVGAGIRLHQVSDHPVAE